MADVFISYSSVNKDAANAICHVLEENGVRCWIAPRDILQGFDYGDVIEKAIRSCKLFVLVYSKTAAVSPWVKGEVNIAFTEGKTILPYRIDETSLDGGLRVMLNQYHWIDSYPDYKMRFKDLLTSVKANLGQSEEYRHIPKPQPTTPKPTPTPAPKPNYLKYILGVLGVVLGIVIGVVLTNNEPAVETIAEEAATEEVIPETSYREEQERLAEEQRKREQEEAARKQCEEQERIAEEQRKQEEAARKQREEQERIAEEQRKRNETTKRSGTINGHDYVDLGLSVKWATCNVGASQPHGYGNYYAWGETSTKSKYTKENSRTYHENMSDIRGNATYDVARANWGGSWRMPTEREMEELENKCTWTWTSQSGVNGYRVTGPNGNSIFLPAAGYCLWSSRNFVGESGYYWSSTPYESNTDYAYYLYFYSGYLNVLWSSRNFGRTVRPVSE